MKREREREIPLLLLLHKKMYHLARRDNTDAEDGANHET